MFKEFMVWKKFQNTTDIPMSELILHMLSVQPCATKESDANVELWFSHISSPIELDSSKSINISTNVVSFVSHSRKVAQLVPWLLLEKLQYLRIATSKLAEINGIQKPRLY